MEWTMKKRKGALGGPLAVFVEVVLGLVVIGALLIFGPVLIGNTLNTTAAMVPASVATSVNATGLAMVTLFSNIPNYLSLVIMAIVFGVAIWAIVAYLGRTGGERV
jgi:hypothetical protein